MNTNNIYTEIITCCCHESNQTIIMIKIIGATVFGNHFLHEQASWSVKYQHYDQYITSANIMYRYQVTCLAELVFRLTAWISCYYPPQSPMSAQSTCKSDMVQQYLLESILM